MPYDDPDPTDPLTMHGVAFQTSDDEALQDMVRCFIEEYARLGFDAERMLRMFRTPGYVGPYDAFVTLGEAEIVRLIDEELSLRPSRPSGSGAAPFVKTEVGISLPVLETGC